MSEESLMVCVEYVKKHMSHKPIWTAVGVPALADPGMKIEIVVKAKSQW
jgi:enamine deaminase RidA (YjgF/YER057c/UK114 family)